MVRVGKSLSEERVGTVALAALTVALVINAVAAFADLDSREWLVVRALVSVVFTVFAALWLGLWLRRRMQKR